MDNTLLIQLLAAAVALAAAGLGWMAKSWSVREQLEAKDGSLKAKDDQLLLLTSQMSLMKEIRPALIQDQLGRAACQIDEQVSDLRDQVHHNESSIAHVEAEIESQRTAIARASIRIADLEQQIKSVDQFRENVQRLVETSGAAYFEAGENTVRGISQDRERLYAGIADEQQIIDAANRSIEELIHEVASLSRRNEEISELMQTLEQRRTQLQIAAEALNATLIAGQSLPGQGRRRQIESPESDLERIDVPRVRTR